MSRSSKKSNAASVAFTPKGSPADISQWLLRSEVAAILRVSVATVRRMEGRNLHPQRSEEGFYLFDPGEVETARAQRPPAPEPREFRDPGELAAEAFKLLRDGVNIRDRVIALPRPPTEIETLYADWERMGNGLVISPRVRSQLERMARHRLRLDAEIMEMIEEDDADTLCDVLSETIRGLQAR
jgi:hypothetical protein